MACQLNSSLVSRKLLQRWVAPQRVARIALLMLIAIPLPIYGYERLLTRNSLQSLGLVRSWSAQSVATRSELPHHRFQLSDSDRIHVYDVVTPDMRRPYAEGSIGPRGQVMDQEDAARQADISMRRLKLDGVAATVEPRTIPSVSLIIQSAAGLVESMDAETGRTKWQLAVGQPGEPGYAPAASDTLAAAVSGSTLYVAEIATGKLVFKQPLSRIPGGGPLLTEEYVFVPHFQGSIEFLPLNPESAKAGSSFLTSHGRLSAQPVHTGDYLCWPTEDQAIYVATVNPPANLFRIKTRSAVVGRIACEPAKLCFAGTEDGYLICIDRTRQQVTWEYLLGSPSRTTPYVLGDAVYVVDADGLLHAVETEMGTERWARAGVRDVVGGVDSRLYCQMIDGRLAAIDVASGDMLGAAPFPAGAQVMRNTLTDRLYFSEGGRICCYRESGRRWPTLTEPLATEEPPVEEEAETATPETPAPAEGPDSDPTPSPPGDDPFGGEAPMGEDNPFGADNPFGEQGPGDDPFGSGGSPFGGDDDPFGF